MWRWTTAPEQAPGTLQGTPGRREARRKIEPTHEHSRFDQLVKRVA